MNRSRTPFPVPFRIDGSAGVPGGQGGISLLEAIIAVALLAMGAAAVTLSSKSSTTGNSSSKMFGSAAAATKEAFEEIRLLPLDSLSRLNATVIGHSQGPSVTVSATARNVQPGDVANFAGLDTSSLRYLIVKTRFRNKAGKNVIKTFSTIVYQP